jgi:long-chain acyl-CoA synthetase
VASIEHAADLSAMLARSAEDGPQRPAVTLGDRTLTYAELNQAASALATALLEQGVAPGDRVGLWMPNVTEFVVAYFAVIRAGGVVVPVSTLLGLEEVAYILSNAEAVALVAASLFDETVAKLPVRVPSLRKVIVWGDTEVADALALSELMSGPARPESLQPSAHDDLAVLIYTSGTTGRPKGAMLSHRNLLTNAAACAQAIDVGPEDRFLTVLPLFHSFGATVCMILPLLIGAHIVLLPRFSPNEVMQAFGAYGITVFAGVPSMYAVLLNMREDAAFDLSSLRLCVTGGAPCPPSAIRQFGERYGAALIEGYGPTEASPVVSVNPPHGVQKVGSVGLPIPGVELSIADDDGNKLPTGEIGEVCVRGPNVMLGYWRAPEATAETVVDDWLLTGDMGRLDEDGYLYIVDRKKDMVIVSGMNVYPREVEDVIYQLPKVADCAVVGAPSERRGEDVRAYIVCKEGQTLTEDEVIQHCSQHLAPYKVPRSVVFADDLPRSGTGKVLKRALR